jgi:hypothetical protein
MQIESVVLEIIFDKQGGHSYKYVEINNEVIVMCTATNNNNNYFIRSTNYCEIK